MKRRWPCYGALELSDRRKFLMRLSLPSLVAVFALGVAAPALAADFSATVKDQLRRPAGPCAGGAFRCGEAFVEGYGAADWSFVVTDFTIVSLACIEYTAITTFTLADDSVLALAETGTVCSPGKSLLKTQPFSWGNPETAVASWEVIGGAGQFAGLTGEGGNVLQAAGAAVSGDYTGELN
jgi:hypothetical protein